MGKLTGTFQNINDDIISVSIDTKNQDIAVCEEFDAVPEANPQTYLKNSYVKSSDASDTTNYWNNNLNSTSKYSISSSTYLRFGTNLVDGDGNWLWLHVKRTKLKLKLWLFKDDTSLVDIFGGTSNYIVYYAPDLETIGTTNKSDCFLSRSSDSSNSDAVFRSVDTSESCSMVGHTEDNNWYDIVFSSSLRADKETCFEFEQSTRLPESANTIWWHYNTYSIDIFNPPLALAHPDINAMSPSLTNMTYNEQYSVAQAFVSSEESYYKNYSNPGWLSNNFKNSVKFAAEPVTIEENCSSTFDHVIKTNATIRFATTKYLGDELWTGDFNAKGIVTGPRTMNGIKQSTFTLFEGYLEPNTYSQPFANFIEEIELNFVDYLTRLEDLKYNNVTPDTFDEMLTDTKNITFKELLIKMLEVNSLDPTTFKIYVTRTIAYDIDDNAYNGFSCAISENYLYGEDYDDTMTYGEILEAMMTYLNMHIKQVGNAWYIFRWDDLRKGNSNFSLFDLYTGDHAMHMSIPKLVLSGSMSAGNDANITLDEVYNQISLKCDMETVETLIESPLDSDSISSVYSNRQLYAREYLVEGEWRARYDGLVDLVKGNHPATAVNYTITDWYVQVMYSKYWTFNWHGLDYANRFQADTNGVYYKQYQMLEYAALGLNTTCPLLLNITKVENPTDIKDDSATYSTSRANYLYIPVNGGALTSETPLASETKWDGITPTVSQLQANSPIAVYSSPRSGSILSPVDDETTNYLVFSGKITLIPSNNTKFTYEDGIYYTQTSGDYVDCATYKDNNGKAGGVAQKITQNGDCIYARRYFRGEYPSDPTDFSLSSIPDYEYNGLSFDDMHAHINSKDFENKHYQYNWTYISQHNGTNYDKIKKLPLLECELTVGDKRLIETNIDESGNSTFEWVTIGEEPEIVDYANDDATGSTAIKKTTFTLGINPAVEDYILGQQYEIQNTVEFTMNLDDLTGTAIPIKRSDELSGKVEFKIVGVINLMYDDVVRRHGTWFRKVKYTQNTISLLKQVKAISISGFECKIASDNAGYDSTVKEDKDLIYKSNESDLAINVKDDIEFKFVTQPTSAECREKNLKNSILQNAVVVGNKTVSKIMAQEKAKAEELYIDSYYNEYSVPKLILEQTIKGSKFEEWSLFSFSMLNKQFYIINKTEDVLNDTYTLKLKEV